MDLLMLSAVVAGVLLLLVAVGGILWWAQWTPHRTSAAESPPPLVFLPAQEPISPSNGHGPPAAPPRRGFEPPALPLEQLPEQERVAALNVAAGTERPRTLGMAADGWHARRSGPALRPTLEEEEEAPPIPAHLSGTLRMLPGRLEIVSGLPTRAELRFVQTTAGGEQRVTIGRRTGTPYEHIQLPSQTVSRMHAAMTYRQGRWSISNLSETNPVRVNGRELAHGGESVSLADGDVIELGEVVLCFRA